VKWFSAKKGYGLIEQEDGQMYSLIIPGSKDRVSSFLMKATGLPFLSSKGQKGPAAVNATVV
jgi:cold shock CspA family protein